MSKVDRGSGQRVIHEARGTLPERPRHHPLLLLPASGEAYYCALNPAVTRIVIHWDTRTESVQWCDETRTCEGCRKGYGARYNYYLPVMVVDKRQFLLSIPSQAFKFSETVQGHNGDLRGLILCGGRLRKSDRGPAKIVVSDKPRQPEAKLPAGWDVLTDLASRWGLVSPGDAWEGGSK